MIRSGANEFLERLPRLPTEQRQLFVSIPKKQTFFIVIESAILWRCVAPLAETASRWSFPSDTDTLAVRGQSCARRHNCARLGPVL